MSDEQPWRTIPLDRVNWRIATSSRNAMVLFAHSVPPRDPKYPAGHESMRLERERTHER